MVNEWQLQSVRQLFSDYCRLVETALLFASTMEWDGNYNRCLIQRRSLLRGGKQIQQVLRNVRLTFQCQDYSLQSTRVIAARACSREKIVIAAPASYGGPFLRFDRSQGWRTALPANRIGVSRKVRRFPTIGAGDPQVTAGNTTLAYRTRLRIDEC